MQNFWNHRLTVLGLFILMCLTVEIAGQLFTDAGVYDWYKTLVKPSWTPPNWVFGPVWTVLYLMMALALWLVWDQQQQNPPHDSTPYFWFGLQLFLNFMWSYLFFTLKNPGYALVDIVLLIGAILGTTLSFKKYSSRASWLMIPYFLWVCYAFTLNLAIWKMN